MELFTRNPLQNISLPMYLEEYPTAYRPCGMLKILFLESGEFEIELLGRKNQFASPCILCLNHKEQYKINASAANARLLYFSPGMVNSSFTLENIAGDISHLSESAKLDHYLFKPFLRSDYKNAECIGLDANSSGRMLALFDSLKTHMSNHQDHYWPCHNRSDLIELLILVQHCKDQEHSHLSGKKDDISEILHYLNLHYANKITIESMCRQFGTNRNTLNKRFRNATGQPVIDYLIKIRINAALRLLRDTTLPIAEIAERVGFSDLSHWGRVFKKTAGMSPLAYRKASIQNRRFSEIVHSC